MTPQLPSFLRRRLRLSEARRALLGGEPEDALSYLADPCLALSEDADRLRTRVLDVLCREAGREDARGSWDEAHRLLELVELHDPQRAGVWRHRLSVEQDSRTAGPSSGLTPGAESGIITALERLLSEMRDERTRSGVRRADPAPSSSDEIRGEPVEDSWDSERREGSEVELDRRFHLAVDDAGELLVAYGNAVTLGHARAEAADLGFLADLDPLHARLYRTESFHAGPGWRIEPIRKQRIAIGGQLVDSGGAMLADGDEVQLSTNFAFRFRRPEAASGSALLELLHGAECEGASSILLFSPGEAGRIHISSSCGRHLRVPRLREEITLWIDGAELVIESKEQLSAGGVDTAIQAPTEQGPGGLRVPCPSPWRIDFSVGSGAGSRPPFGFSVRPVERSPSKESRR